MLDASHADVNKKPSRQAPQWGYDLLHVLHSARSNTDIPVQKKMSLDPKAKILQQDLSQAMKLAQHYIFSSFFCFCPPRMLALQHSSSAAFLVSWSSALQLNDN